MEKTKPIPISKAKEIAALGYDEVIIVGCQYADGIQHVTTFGKSQAACENAAIGGNQVKCLLKWPEEKCQDKPARQKRKEKMKWSDEDMVRFASKCFYSKEEGVAYSDLLSEYEKEDPRQNYSLL